MPITLISRPEIQGKSRPPTVDRVSAHRESHHQVEMEKRLANWWQGSYQCHRAVARAQQSARSSADEEQQRLLEALLPVGVLDEFHVAGVFVNWWETVRYDLKTIIAAGWSPNLIPDEYIQNAFFKEEQNKIETLDARAAVLEAELSEGLEAVEVEEEDDEEKEEESEKAPTTAERKQALKAQIVELKAVCHSEADQAELKTPSETLQRIESVEKALKEAKKAANSKRAELEQHLTARRMNLTTEESETLVLSKFRYLLFFEMN